MRITETRYQGYRFRSRTEARWAVFFDEILIRYEYEKEGFILPGGITYLPDFFLTDLEVWVEVKGAIPTAAEMGKCRQLHKITGKTVVLIRGIPDPNTSEFYTYDASGERGPIISRYLAHYLMNIVCEAGSRKRFKRGDEYRMRAEIGKLITCENEYEGDEYAFGVAKATRFGEVA